MKYSLRSMHYSPSGEWLKQTLDIEFGPAGIEELEKMRSTRQSVGDVGAVALSDHETIGNIDENAIDAPGYIYQLNGQPAWITRDEANRFQAEGANAFCISDCLTEIEAWMFYHHYLEDKNVKFSTNKDDPERKVIHAADGRVLWASNNSRE